MDKTWTFLNIIHYLMTHAYVYILWLCTILIMLFIQTTDMQGLHILIFIYTQIHIWNFDIILKLPIHKPLKLIHKELSYRVCRLKIIPRNSTIIVLPLNKFFTSILDQITWINLFFLFIYYYLNCIH